jgi:hypothetical protein
MTKIISVDNLLQSNTSIIVLCFFSGAGLREGTSKSLRTEQNCKNVGEES